MCKIYTRDKSEKLENNIKTFVKNNKFEMGSSKDIIQECRKLGFEVYAMDLKNIDGLILFDKENNKKVIAVNSNLKIEQVRFAIAHEIGHYIDWNLNKQNFKRGIAHRDHIFNHNNKPESEQNMDYMAAAILIPKNELIAKIKDIGLTNKLKELVENSSGEIKENDIKTIVDNEIIHSIAKEYIVDDEVVVKRLGEVAYYVQ